MRKFGLIGYPLGHSFSKKYFTEKFQKQNISECFYENYPLTNLEHIQKLLSQEPYLFGLNVTIPYKSQIIKFLDTIDHEAEEIGSVNVIKIRRSNGEIVLSGYNSDIVGIRDSLMPFITPQVRSAIVLGTGGSSRAVCYVLKMLGLKISLVSRKRASGILDYSDLDFGLISNTELIVNTTPLGMYPDIEGKPDIKYDLLSDKHILFDLVYNPECTSFLRLGSERGCKTINGLKMLHSQAERAWQIWNDDSL